MDRGIDRGTDRGMDRGTNNETEGVVGLIDLLGSLRGVDGQIDIGM